MTPLDWSLGVFATAFLATWFIRGIWRAHRQREANALKRDRAELKRAAARAGGGG